MRDANTIVFVLASALVVGGALASRLAARFHLPALTGQLLTGVAVGALLPSQVRAAGPWLETAQLACGAVVLLWIGGQLSVARLRRDARATLGMTGLIALSSGGCALVLALPLFELGENGLVTTALVLAATSPSILAIIAHERGRSMPAALDAAVLANVCIAISAVALTASSSALLSDIAIGLATGVALGLLVGRAWGLSDAIFAALGAIAFALMGLHLAHPEAAIAIAALAGGAVAVNAGGHAPIGRLTAHLPLVGSALFVTTGALVDFGTVVALLPIAICIALARAVFLWLGARLSSGDALHHAAPFLPQGGFSLAIVSVLGGLASPLIALIVAVAVINELAMPPILDRALRRA